MRPEIVHAEEPERVAGRRQVACRPVGPRVEVDLAELGADEAVLPQVREALEDHLPRVEVALGEHVGARGGGVHGRIAVGGDEPDEVVPAVVAAEERAPLAVHQGDALVLGQAAAPVGEVGGEQRDRGRVQLDRGDVCGAEVERGEDLVAAGGADDDDPRRGSEQPEGIRAPVVVEAREGGQVAVEAIQHRADHGVVVDDVAVLGGGAGEDVDAKDRGPAGVED